MTHFGADVTLLPSEPKPNFSTLAKVDMLNNFHLQIQKLLLLSIKNVLRFGLPLAMFITQCLKRHLQRTTFCHINFYQNRKRGLGQP